MARIKPDAPAPASNARAGDIASDGAAVGSEATTLPPHFSFKLGEDVCILGSKASGKTVMMHHIYANCTRAIAFNAGGEVGFHYLSNAYVMDDVRALKHALDARDGNGQPLYPRVEFVASDDLIGNENKLREVYDQVCGLAYGAGNIALLNDELAMVTGGENVTHWMRLLALRGRHHGVSHIFAGQRNQLIPKTLVAQAAHTVIYAIREYDAKVYSQWIGFDLAEALRSAPYQSYKFLWVTEMQWRLMQPVPLLIDEQTGDVRVTVQEPVHIQ